MENASNVGHAHQPERMIHVPFHSLGFQPPPSRGSCPTRSTPSPLRPLATACLPSSSRSLGTTPPPHSASHFVTPGLLARPRQLPCLRATTTSGTTPLSQGEMIFTVRLPCVFCAVPSFDPQKLPHQEDCLLTSPFTREETETQRSDISLGVPSPSLRGAP